MTANGLLTYRGNAVNLLKSLTSLVKYQNTIDEIEDSVQRLVLEKLIEDACSLVSCKVKKKKFYNINLFCCLKVKNALGNQSLNCTSENELDTIVQQAIIYQSLFDIKHKFRRIGNYRPDAERQVLWIGQNIHCNTGNGSITRNHLANLFPDSLSGVRCSPQMA